MDGWSESKSGEKVGSSSRQMDAKRQNGPKMNSPTVRLIRAAVPTGRKGVVLIKDDGQQQSRGQKERGD